MNNTAYSLAFWWLMFVSIAPWVAVFIFWKFGKGAK